MACHRFCFRAWAVEGLRSEIWRCTPFFVPRRKRSGVTMAKNSPDTSPPKIEDNFRTCSRSNSSAKPFVKWAGGKGQLIEQILPLLPDDIRKGKRVTYIEPFIGGGALLFRLLATFPNITRAVVNDINPDLILTYRMVRDRLSDLTSCLSDFQEKYRKLGDEAARKAFYLAQRECYNAGGNPDVERAGLFIFLNRTCFNGLHRVNSKGWFNVPFGRSVNPLICDEETLAADSELLQRVEIRCGDFEKVTDGIDGSAFFYFDPPYKPLGGTSSFTAYAKDGFGDADQERLAAFCRKLDKAGFRWLLSNADLHGRDPEDCFFDNLYAGFRFASVQARRMVNANPEKRGAISELVIRNYGD